MSERLAVKGGTPVRDIASRPWPRWPCVSEEEWVQKVEPALRRVYLSGVEGLPGPAAQAFASRFAAYCGTKYGRLLVHGTDAIAAALAATLGLDAWGEGGEVILPNYTFIASASATLDRRCTLAFVDIDPETFTLDPKAVEDAVVPGKTRAIMPVHLGGHPADMASINAIAERHGLVVIEDCAQAHGARYNERPVGSIGHVGAFSFQSTKNLTSGEGGAVTTNDPQIDAGVLAFMDVGRDATKGRWEYPRLGWNYRPSEYLAALLSVRLDVLDEQTEHRARMAAILSRELAGIPGVRPPAQASWCSRHACHLYCIMIEPDAFGGRPRDAIVEALTAEGVPALAGYTMLLSDTPAIAQLAEAYPQTVRTLPCPNTQDVCARSIWLTQDKLLAGEDDMADIVEAVAKVQRVMSRA
jgi:dTDP-4-amino-4,6-dideoxygalactose transaminase